jgi:hypothetical protein
VRGACSTHGREEKSVQNVGGKTRRKETTRKTEAQIGEWNQNGRLVGGGGVEWIHLAQDRDRRWAVVNAVMNLRVLAPQS